MLSIDENVSYDIVHRVKESMHSNRGDLIRLADTNMEIPGYDEVGLFALPAKGEHGDISWVLIDGSCSKVTASCSLQQLVLFIVRNYNDKAALTDIARGLI